jgi:predicted kinase
MIVVVFGLPATGKSQIAGKLAEELNAVYLNTDIVKSNLNLTGQNDDETHKLVYDQLVFELSTQIQYKHNVVLDGVFHTESIRNRFIEKAKKYEQDIWFIEVKASDQAIKERLYSQNHDADEVYNAYLKLRLSFESQEQSHLVLWSDQNSADENVETAKAIILKG